MMPSPRLSTTLPSTFRGFPSSTWLNESENAPVTSALITSPGRTSPGPVAAKLWQAAEAAKQQARKQSESNEAVRLPGRSSPDPPGHATPWLWLLMGLILRPLFALHRRSPLFTGRPIQNPAKHGIGQELRDISPQRCHLLYQ